MTAFSDETGRGWLPLKYEDGPDFCTVTLATGAAFALTVHPERMKLMEAALSASPVGEPWPQPKITNPDIVNPTGVPYIDSLIHQVLDAQQDINFAANTYMDQNLSDTASLLDEVETALRKMGSLSAPVAQEPVAWRSRSIFNDVVFTFFAVQPPEHEQYITEPLYTFPPATPAGLGAEKLRELASCLDRALGDTDPSINPDYTDDEIKRDYPVFWVCQQLNAILALLSRAGDQK